jgi:NAD(P)-dependent dehydrogenase (short-subunit alcohol dehydrogenase family)
MQKHFVVAGGSHGIGLELTQRLLNQGFNVTCISRNSDPCGVGEVLSGERIALVSLWECSGRKR